ncbi:MAG: hypothetical protein ABSA41_11345 [Terriglobia bacterium]|jgi:hypothetical protein
MRFPPLVILLLIALALTLAPANWAQQRPFTQDQVQGLVRDGLGDESGAKLIEQRGIDFAPAEDFMQSLKAAGASEVFLKALRAAKQPEPASAKKPLKQGEVFALLAGQVPCQRVAALVQERGIDFEPTDDYLQEVRLAGGEDELISALKGAKVMKPGQTTARQYYSELIEHASSLKDFVKLAFPPIFGPRSPLVCFPNDPLSLPAHSRSDTDFFIISPSTPDYLRDEVGAEGSELLFQTDLQLLKGVLLEISKTPPDPAFLAKLSKGFIVINHFDRGIGGAFIVLPLYSGFDFRDSLGADATVWTLAKWAKEDNQLATLEMVNESLHKNNGHLSADFKFEPTTGRFIFGLMIDDKYFSTNQRFGVCELVKTKDGRNPLDAYPVTQPTAK